MLSPNWQLNDGVVLTSKTDCEVLHFVMSTDGVSPAKSKKFCLYPVWLMLLNLPEKGRACYKNLILISLYGGVKKNLIAVHWLKFWFNLFTFLINAN